MDRYKISIVTVCYNRAGTIRDTIESVLAQSYENIEYIVIDGKSKDKTMDIINEYIDKISVVLSEPDRGMYDALNKGIRMATGDVVGILNSDDVFFSNNAIDIVMDIFNKDRSTDMVFGDVVFVEPKNINSITRYYSSSRFKPWKLRFGWMPPHPATFVRRHLYNKYGFYRLDYYICSDFEMFVRLLLIHKLCYVRLNKILVRMRQGGISTSGLKNSLVLNREIIKACRDNGVYTNLAIVLFKIPFKLMELVKKPKTSIS